MKILRVNFLLKVFFYFRFIMGASTIQCSVLILLVCTNTLILAEAKHNHPQGPQGFQVSQKMQFYKKKIRHLYVVHAPFCRYQLFIISQKTMIYRKNCFSWIFFKLSLSCLRTYQNLIICIYINQGVRGKRSLDQSPNLKEEYAQDSNQQKNSSETNLLENDLRNSNILQYVSVCSGFSDLI